MLKCVAYTHFVRFCSDINNVVYSYVSGNKNMLLQGKVQKTIIKIPKNAVIQYTENFNIK